MLKKAVVISGMMMIAILMTSQTLPKEMSKAQEPEITVLLDRLADTCSLLSRALLDFICRERIRQSYYSLRQDIRGVDIFDRRPVLFLNSWVYDYQLIRESSGLIRERRILLKRGNINVRVEDAKLETHIVRFGHVIMGPLDLLSWIHQDSHDYAVIGEEKIGGQIATVIEAVPKEGVILGHLYGKIWVRTEDAGILKIEWNPRSVGNYAQVEETGRKLDMTPSITISSEFAYEKNRIRFPSRLVYKEEYLGKKHSFLRAVTEVFYDQYKFFVVDTDAVIKEPDS